MIPIAMKGIYYLERISRAEACIYKLQYGDVGRQERKNLLEEVKSMNLDPTFWAAAALVAKCEDLRRLCTEKALASAGEDEIYPMMQVLITGP